MVTVLMSVWNTAPILLERSIGSILAQTFKDFEFLILDDGSAGAATRDALDGWAARDPRIRLYHEPHRGLTGALNRGLELAQGAWIARQDADDWSEPDRLERQRAYLEAHPATDLLGSAAWTHQDDGRALWPIAMPLTHEEILEEFWRGSPFVHGAAMFRTRTARALGGYRRELSYAQDYDFFWRMAQKGEAANLREALYHYRYAGDSVSAARAAEQARARGAAQILAQARFRGEPEDVARALAQSDLAAAGVQRAALKQADHLMLAGRYGRALAAYWEAVVARPASWAAWIKLARLPVFYLAPAVRRFSFR